MIGFMQQGGTSMWLILALGLLTLGLAGSFAARPAERKLSMIRPLSLATVFSVLGGIAADLGATMKAVSASPELAASPAALLQGIGESMVPAILGFTLLSLAWLVATAGLRRQL